LKGGKETSDLAEYFPPFETQIGPKIKKMASDYFSASLLTAKQTRSSVTKAGGPLPVCESGCEASLKQDFFLMCKQFFRPNWGKQKGAILKNCHTTLNYNTLK